MKNKRVLMLLLVLALILFLGIGYALKTKELTITGMATATASDNNFTVRFKKTGTSYDEPTGLTNATATVTADNQATINVSGLTKVGETATATYAVENVSHGIDANVKAVATIGNTEYFKVTTEGITGEETKLTSDTSSNTTSITVKVELIKTPLEDLDSNVTVTLTATPVAQ